MAEKKQLTITEEQQGQRLDLVISLLSDDLSRSAVKKIINEGGVEVNDEVEFRPNYKVKNGDILSIQYQLQQQPDIEPENIPLEILYEDNDLIVINKPAGMVTHPATGNWTGTLMNAVLYHYQNQTSVGDNNRSGLIHRLDKDTSGLILIGKTNKGLWHYSKQFAERKVHKSYLAVVRGDISEFLLGRKKLIRNYLGRNPGNRKKMAVVEPVQGRLAETEFSLIENLSRESQIFSKVLAEPRTGRTHQIRVHLATAGYPILGDVIYGKGNKFSRLMLHAWKLKIESPQGKLLEFTAPEPKEFKNLNA